MTLVIWWAMAMALSIASGAVPPHLVPLDVKVPEVLELKDGTPVWWVDQPGSGLLSVEVRVFQPSEQHSEAALGLAGALLDQGTAQLTRDEFSDAVAMLGAHVRVGSLPDGLFGRFTTPSDHLDETASLVRQALGEPAFDRSVFRASRTERINRNASAVHQRQRVHSSAIRRAVFPADHPLGGFTDRKDNSTVSLADVRAAHELVWSQGRMAIVAVGEMDQTELLDLLNQHFARPGKPRTGEPPAANYRNPAPDEPRLVLVDQSGWGLALATVSLSVAPGLDVSHPDAALACGVLWGQGSGPMVRRLRTELGLVYSLDCGTRVFPHFARLEMTAATDPESVAALLVEMTNALESAAGLSAADLKRAQALELANQMARMERIEDLAAWLSDQQALGLPPDWGRRQHLHVMKADLESASSAFGQLFNRQKMLWVVSGDRVVIEPLLDQSERTPDTIWSAETVLSPRKVDPPG